MTLASTSMIELNVLPKKSLETNFSSDIPKTPARAGTLGVCSLADPEWKVGARAAALRNGRRSSSLEATGVERVTVKSTRETFVTGTLIDMPIPSA